ADAAKCISCHEKPDGKALNAYGQELAAMGSKESLADRILRLEADPPLDAKPEDRKRIEKNHDVDGDGVPNWIEIRSGTSRAKKDSVPNLLDVERIKSAIACTS